MVKTLENQKGNVNLEITPQTSINDGWESQKAEVIGEGRESQTGKEVRQATCRKTGEWALGHTREQRKAVGELEMAVVHSISEMQGLKS